MPNMVALTIVATLGAVQGALLLLLIAFRMRHRKNVSLVILLLVFSVRLVTIPTWNPITMLAYPILFPLTTPLPFLFGPLLWWYARELGSDRSAVPPLIPLHFVPYLAETLIVTITIVTMTHGEYEGFVESVFSGNPPLWLPLRNALKVALNLVYLFLAGRIAFGGASSRLSRARRTWLRTLVVVPSAALLLFSYVAVVPGATARFAEGSGKPFFLLSLAMAGFIYTISLLMLISPNVSAWQDLFKRRTIDPICSRSECENLVKRVEQRLAGGAFLDPDLSLSDLAAQLRVHRNRLSFAINDRCQVPFRALLNTRRLEHLTGNIKKGALKSHTILELAFDAGFPSKSTFNRVFKEDYGITPSQYAKQISIQDVRNIPITPPGESPTTLV